MSPARIVRIVHGYPGGPSASGPSWGWLGGWAEYRAEGTGFREEAISL
jgi:hypothetical protein